MTLNFAPTAIRPVLVFALVGLWLASYPEQSYACSCAYPYTPSEALERSAAVFAGRVISIDQGTARQQGWSSIAVEFDVSTVWKGPDQKTMRMRTPGINNSCHFPFREGVEYLVFSLDGSNVGWCSPVRPISEAADDLAELGEGQILSRTEAATTPMPEASEQPAGGGCGPSSNADGLLMVGLVVGLAWCGFGKRRPVKRP